MTIKYTSQDEILAEEEKFLGIEIGNFFADDTVKLKGYGSIVAELLYSSDPAVWIDYAFQACFETWNKTPEYPIDKFRIEKSNTLKAEFIVNMLNERPISAVLESVNFGFYIKGIPRNLSAQLCRHREFSLCERSMRVSSCYSDSVRYPQNLIEKRDDYEFLKEYGEAVLACKRLYKKMILAGVPMEQARNIMPIGVLTSITFTCNLKSLINYMNARISDITMDEHTFLVYLMAKELRDKSSFFYDKIILPKVKNLSNVMTDYGKYERGVVKKCDEELIRDGTVRE